MFSDVETFALNAISDIVRDRFPGVVDCMAGRDFYCVNAGGFFVCEVQVLNGSLCLITCFHDEVFCDVNDPDFVEFVSGFILRFVGDFLKAKVP